MKSFILCGALCLLLALACRGITSTLERPTGELTGRDVITLAASGTHVIKADGADTIRLSARISSNATQRSITFSTTAGVFLESAAKQVTVRATVDSIGGKTAVASTLLRSDTAAATAIVRATIGDFYDTLSVSFAKP